MNRLSGLRCVVVLTVGWAGHAHAAGVPVCSDAQMNAHATKAEEVAAHRKFDAPSVTYPFGAEPDGAWGFELIVRVDESGAVTCYRTDQESDREVALNPQRRKLIETLSQWRYSPFIRDGRAVGARVGEQIYEEEAPQSHLAPPDVPLQQVHVGLQRTGCFGTCPSYSVHLYGDGRVVYEGSSFVDVTGEHVFRVPPDRIAKLVASLRAKGLWSLRESYQAPVTDNPGYVLTLEFGGQTHEITDYVGHRAGMPRGVSQFEDEVDEAAYADAWIHFGMFALERLKAAGFNFRSQAGADLLARTIVNDRSHDDRAMLRLVELGAPITGAKPPDELYCCLPRNLLDAALVNQRAAVIDALIDRGALETNGTADQQKIDAAFRAAVIGGRLELVQKIWSVSGTRQHPSLTFDDESDDEPPVKKESPVTLLLHLSRHHTQPWQGLEIARWLSAQGCDLKAARANGNTLLHIATEADDLQFVRYLLSQGLDPSTKGHYGPALGAAEDEDIAMALLEAGTDVSLMDDKNYSFRRYAEAQHWGRVIVWLDAH
jgi:hypothetical protein